MWIAQYLCTMVLHVNLLWGILKIEFQTSLLIYWVRILRWIRSKHVLLEMAQVIVIYYKVSEYWLALSILIFPSFMMQPNPSSAIFRGAVWSQDRERIPREACDLTCPKAAVCYCVTRRNLTNFYEPLFFCVKHIFTIYQWTIKGICEGTLHHRKKWDPHFLISN